MGNSKTFAAVRKNNNFCTLEKFPETQQLTMLIKYLKFQLPTVWQISGAHANFSGLGLLDSC